ncbi:hypothetical protein [Pelomonas sp. Root1217]|uniref:hypothetical protein n=1 Tax=Pelomonas sp. Root1217 TaxID=1736430 RepID=UPI0012FB43BC|nr:hypothetical protein [Pelomonas sp. Root1217]
MSGQTLIKSAILIVSAGFSIGSASATECDGVGLNAGVPKIKANATVDIVIKPNTKDANGNDVVGADVKDAVTRAISLLTGQVAGINFQLVTEYDIDRPNINISFPNTKSPTNNRTAVIESSPPVNGFLDSAEVKVFLGQDGCSKEAISLCFNPQMPGYNDAMYRSVVHELLHALGASDSKTGSLNIMSDFQGVNSSGNQAWGVGCIVDKLPGLRGDPLPLPPRPPVCLR